MNINEIKAKLGVETLPLEQGVDKDGVVTQWLSNWNNETRTRIAIHEDLLKTVRQETNLFIQTSERIAEGSSGLAYTLHIICKSNAVIVDTL